MPGFRLYITWIQGVLGSQASRGPSGYQPELVEASLLIICVGGSGILSQYDLLIEITSVLTPRARMSVVLLSACCVAYYKHAVFCR